MVRGRNTVRPFTARSIIGSLLLGVTPPRLSSRHLVEAGALFGVTEGTIRVALTRMTRTGELTSDSGYYELAGQLLDRYERQRQSRTPSEVKWSGDWRLLMVQPTRRPAGARARLREAARLMRYGELREGVWIRPDNLPSDSSPDSWSVVSEQCRTMTAQPEDEAELVTELWDMTAWNKLATGLRSDMAPLVPRLLDGDSKALAPAFEVAAGVVRHLLADPLLPAELLAPDHSGPALRSEYDEYETAFKELWRDFFAAPR